MFEYVATLIGMQQTDQILLAEAQAKESNKTAIVQMAVQNSDQPCSYKDHKKIKECFNAKSKLQEKTPDPYQDMWDRDWVNKKD
jgi:GTP-sensing pleiotropic transcriptional regulator CodY